MWAKQDVGLEWFATWETSILQHSILPMLHLNWNRPSPTAPVPQEYFISV